VWRGASSASKLCTCIGWNSLSGVVLSIGEHRLHRWNRSHRLHDKDAPSRVYCFSFLAASYLTASREICGFLLGVDGITETKVLFKVWMRRVVVRIFPDASSVQIGRCTAFRAGRCTDYARDARCRWFATIINYVTFASLNL
jgi:hypothetical protein